MRLKFKLEPEPEPEPGQSDSSGSDSSQIPWLRAAPARKPLNFKNEHSEKLRGQIFFLLFWGVGVAVGISLSIFFAELCRVLQERTIVVCIHVRFTINTPVGNCMKNLFTLLVDSLVRTNGFAEQDIFYNRPCLACRCLS